ncbi:MAG: hypothetical protein HY021_02530 [Burkholderiales bacterium]|nr:hypothetical protein [Burkholderiales bacterium]
MGKPVSSRDSELSEGRRSGLSRAAASEWRESVQSSSFTESQQARRRRARRNNRGRPLALAMMGIGLLLGVSVVAMLIWQLVHRAA